MTHAARQRGLGVACIACAVALGSVVTRFGSPNFDDVLGDEAARARDGAPGVIFDLLSEVGYTSGYAALVIAVVVALVLAGRRRGAVLLVAAVLLANASFALLKRVFERERPEFADHLVGGFAMPSGHATMAFVLATSVLLVEPRLRTWWAASLLVAYAVLTAASRVVLGVHYLTDVTAGALLGIGCALLVVPREPRTGPR